MGHCYLILLLLINTPVPFSSGKGDRVCISQGSRFPPYASQGKPPKRVSKGPKDLTLCRVFRKNTCCDVAQTHPALLAIRKLASAGEANSECLQLWELLECSICDPRIGVQRGPPVICASFCDRVFNACSGAYYSTDAITQVLAPCGVNNYVCGKASEWIHNGTEFCHAAGFSVKGDMSESLEETFCYGGKASLDLIADSWKVLQSEVPQKVGSLGLLEEFRQRVREMPYNERVSWAVGGLVLTGGLFFVSRKKGHNQRLRQAALRRTAKNVEAKMYPQSADSHGNRKISMMEGKTTELCGMSEEIMVSILSWLPPKSVMRFKCVRKSWYSLIINSSFIAKHLSNTMCNKYSTSILCKRFVLRDIDTIENEVVCSLITFSNNDEQDAHSVVEDIQIPPSFGATTRGQFVDFEALFAASIIGHCNGIICMHFGLGRQDITILWNPAIKDFMILPEQSLPCGSVTSIAFGYDPKSKDYKVLSIVALTAVFVVERYVYDHPTVEVYTLSTDSWRENTSCCLETETTIFDPLYYQMYWKGFCYWIGSERQKEYMDRFDRDYDDYPRQVIHIFDMSEEVFDDILLPRCLYEPMARFFDMHIIPWNGSVALFGLYSLTYAETPIENDAFGVWVLNSYGNVKGSWTKHLTLDVVMGIQKELVLWKKNEMLMVGKDGRIFTHNFETQTFEYLSGHGVYPSYTEAVICVNSIVPIKPVEKQQI